MCDTYRGGEHFPLSCLTCIASPPPSFFPITIARPLPHPHRHRTRKAEQQPCRRRRLRTGTLRLSVQAWLGKHPHGTPPPIHGPPFLVHSPQSTEARHVSGARGRARTSSRGRARTSARPGEHAPSGIRCVISRVRRGGVRFPVRVSGSEDVGRYVVRLIGRLVSWLRV